VNRSDRPRAPHHLERKKLTFGVLGFVVSLGIGFFIGHAVRSSEAPQSPRLEPDAPRFRPQLRGDEPQRGPDDALVTIVAFGDYQCSYCARAGDPLDEILETFEADVRLIYKHFPLPSHREALTAAKAAVAAHAQGRFWPVHRTLFEVHGSVEALQAHLAELDLDAAAFREALVAPETAAAVDEDVMAGAKLGVFGTPVFFVNGHRHVGVQSAERWRQILAMELENARALVESGVDRSAVYDALMEHARPSHIEPAAGGASKGAG
jgi:predicted DsbA family dithiol-disulfide isomerase